MALELKNPLALLAIVPAVLVSVYIYRKYEEKPKRRILPLVLRLVIISLLVFALMEPVIKSLLILPKSCLLLIFPTAPSQNKVKWRILFPSH